MAYASFFRRIAAFFIDYILIVLYGIIIVGSISFLLKDHFSSSPYIAQIIGFFTFTFPVSLYFIVSERSARRGTFGKQRLKLSVVNLQGKRITLLQSIVRNGIKFFPWEVAHFAVWHLSLSSNFSEPFLTTLLIGVNTIIFLYVITPFINNKRRNIYDWIARTAVVRNPPSYGLRTRN